MANGTWLVRRRLSVARWEIFCPFGFYLAARRTDYITTRWLWAAVYTDCNAMEQAIQSVLSSLQEKKRTLQQIDKGTSSSSSQVFPLYIFLVLFERVLLQQTAFDLDCSMHFFLYRKRRRRRLVRFVETAEIDHYPWQRVKKGGPRESQRVVLHVGRCWKSAQGPGGGFSRL